MKRILSVFLVVVLVMGMSLSVSAAATKAETFQDKVNAMELEPLKPSYWSAAFIKRVEAAVKGKETNYEKMVAAYDYIRTNATDKKLMDGHISGYNMQLQCALEVIGFRTYYVSGEWTAKDGWDTTWVGIDIGNNLYYFDAGLPAVQGVSAKQCFGVAYKSSKLYKNATIYQMEIEPVVVKGGALKIILADADGIPNSVSKRKPYCSVPDKCHPPSKYYEPDGIYWNTLMINLNGPDTSRTNPVLVTDKEGVQYTFYPDGRREEFTGTIKKAS